MTVLDRDCSGKPQVLNKSSLYCIGNSKPVSSCDTESSPRWRQNHLRSQTALCQTVFRTSRVIGAQSTSRKDGLGSSGVKTHTDPQVRSRGLVPAALAQRACCGHCPGMVGLCTMETTFRDPGYFPRLSWNMLCLQLEKLVRVFGWRCLWAAVMSEPL